MSRRGTTATGLEFFEEPALTSRHGILGVGTSLGPQSSVLKIEGRGPDRRALREQISVLHRAYWPLSEIMKCAGA
jgi:hypothetical protein